MPLHMPVQDPCSFCENFAGRWPWHGKPAVVFEDDEVYVIIAPAALGGMPGHCLVIPRRHVPTLMELTYGEESALAHAIGRTSRSVLKAFDADGIVVVQRNGTIAEQTVPHVHVHVIPRRGGTPYPPSQWVENTSAEERAEQAERLNAVY